MEKNLDWGNLGFGYMKTDYRYVANYKDGKWTSGQITTDDKVVISECACVLQYAQTCFEGLKAYRTKNNKVVCFRPDLNGERMEQSAARLEMPVFPKERFLEAVKQVVKANIDWVPPYGSGASLYIRPYMFGTDPVMGVKPANEYQFRIIVSPVGPYFKGGVKPITLRVPDFDRAAPRGTGHVKAGLNYAMSLHAIVDAHNQDNEVVTPKSNTILPSITRRSLMYVAEHYLGLKATEREIRVEELKDFKECALCGTAAVLSPVGKVVDHGKEIIFPSGMEKAGEITQKLYETLTGIQKGEIDSPKGWIFEIN